MHQQYIMKKVLKISHNKTKFMEFYQIHKFIINLP